MDAMTINGAKSSGIKGAGDQRFFDWAQPGDGFNFSATSGAPRNNPFWDAPNRIPENPYSNANVSSFGVSQFLKSTVPPNAITFETSDISLHNTVHPDPQYNGVVYFVWDGVRKYLKREKELLEQFFNVELPTPIYSGDNIRPLQLMQLLRLAYNNETITELYTIWNALKLDRGSGGAQVDVDLIQQQLEGFINYFSGDGDPEEIISNSLQLAIETPFDYYGPRDAWRLFNFLTQSHNLQTLAYGDGSQITMFPPRDSFWDKLWVGIKKWFPGLIIARNAFLGLVGLNVFNLAGRIDSTGTNKRQDISDAWKNLGGNTSSLNGAVNSGKNKNPIMGDAGATATLIAAATPIVVAIIKMLGDEDIDNIVDAVTTAADANCQEYAVAMTDFVASFHLEGTDAGSLIDQFEFQFPDIPDECIESLETIYETFTGDPLTPDGDQDSSGGGDTETSPGDTGGGDDDIPIGETFTPLGNNSGLLIAGIVGAVILANNN